MSTFIERHEQIEDLNICSADHASYFWDEDAQKVRMVLLAAGDEHESPRIDEQKCGGTDARAVLEEAIAEDMTVVLFDRRGDVESSSKPHRYRSLMTHSNEQRRRSSAYSF